MDSEPPDLRTGLTRSLRAGRGSTPRQTTEVVVEARGVAVGILADGLHPHPKPLAVIPDRNVPHVKVSLSAGELVAAATAAWGEHPDADALVAAALTQLVDQGLLLATG